MISDTAMATQKSTSPKRISVTVPGYVYDALMTRADREGRSTSDLCAYLLERAVEAGKD